MKPMNEYEFSIVIRDADFSDLKVHDLLFDNGCDDALICANNDTVYLQFTREANSAFDAITSALANIKDAGFNDLIVEEGQAITISEIASKAELSRQAIHNYVQGRRGDSKFPKPIAGLSSNNPLYNWYEVAHWLNKHKVLSNESLEVACAASKFHHEVDMSLIDNLPTVTTSDYDVIPLVWGRSIQGCLGQLYCDSSVVIKVTGDQDQLVTQIRSPYFIGKISNSYGGIREVYFELPDLEDSKKFSILPAHR